MAHIKTFTAIALVAGLASASASAQTQTAIGAGTYASTSASQTTGSGINYMNLGDAGYSGSTSVVVSRMPMSLSYGSVTANISFTGEAGVYDAGAYAPSAGNYLIAATGGTVTLGFSQTQSYFSTRWMSQDPGNTFNFYNGDQLVASTTGAVVRPLSLASTGTNATFVDFNFTELGYDRVVVSATLSGWTEFGEIAFSQDVQAAPIPLNAASLGGLMSFLMMLGLRGKGGTQVALRMAFASIMPRRRGLA